MSYILVDDDAMSFERNKLASNKKQHGDFSDHNDNGANRKNVVYIILCIAVMD
jgi:hypothetical protein